VTYARKLFGGICRGLAFDCTTCLDGHDAWRRKETYFLPSSSDRPPGFDARTDCPCRYGFSMYLRPWTRKDARLAARIFFGFRCAWAEDHGTKFACGCVGQCAKVLPPFMSHIARCGLSERCMAVHLCASTFFLCLSPFLSVPDDDHLSNWRL